MKRKLAALLFIILCIWACTDYKINNKIIKTYSFEPINKK